MVSIVSTAQASLINEDTYSRKQFRTNNRSCGIWGTAFCCLNLKKSVLIITLFYGIVYLYSKIGELIFLIIIFNLIFLRLVFLIFNLINKNIHQENIGTHSQLFNGMLVNLTRIIDKNFINKLYNSRIFLRIFSETYVINVFLNYLEISCFIYGIVFTVGILNIIFSRFWLTAIFLGLVWIDSIKSISALLYFTYLTLFISKIWYINVYIVIISMFLLSIMYFLSYYTTQIVYSLYLVQLAGGKGDEYVSYNNLRRVIRNENATFGTNKHIANVNEQEISGRNEDENLPFIQNQKESSSNVV